MKQRNDTFKEMISGYAGSRGNEPNRTDILKMEYKHKIRIIQAKMWFPNNTVNESKLF